MIAAEYGQIDLVRELLNPVYKNCARANVLSSPALALDAKQGHVHVVLELLDSSRELHAVAADDACAAARWAANNGHLGCLRAFLDPSRGSFVAPSTGDNVFLTLAPGKGQLHIVQELLDTSRPNHATAEARDSATFWYAAKSVHTDILRELLWREYRPASPLSDAGDAALAQAISIGNLECCRLLLDYPELPPRDLPEPIRQAVSDDKDIIALIKEAERRYQSAAGSRSYCKTKYPHCFNPHSNNLGAALVDVVRSQWPYHPKTLGAACRHSHTCRSCWTPNQKQHSKEKSS